MISTRRIATVLAVAAGVSGFAVSSANAAGPLDHVGKPLNPISELDNIAASGIPAPYAAQLPGVKQQLAGLNHLNDLSQLHQVTDPVAPLLGLVPLAG
ncbi:hypothetical protein N4G70_30005 [Streptomyces sp. ASQP_92]|uniref:hypothetical protein n=1 Tax=unclassified Streptomyces TaxID=2593676 RepID=UPI0021BE0033|nr:hypothetical protein [Streptomyces sp. ASQP_92]MCT9093070.1 hypothetical protein [Streptomyces sp. ASQP_92]